MYNSTNLLSLASDSGNPKKYGFNVFKSLYDDEEMVNHAIEPNSKAHRNGTIAFDEKRVNLLKSKFHCNS